MSKFLEIKKVLEGVNEESISEFYRNDIVNWTGPGGSKESFSEIISKWLLENLELLKSIKPLIRKKRNGERYKLSSHESPKLNCDSNREEEKLAIYMHLSSYEDADLGKVIDYQIPIKDKETGRIDLLTYQDSRNELRLVELKNSKSKETLLRCILEIYTYSRQVNQDELCTDFGLEAKKPNIIPTILLFKDSNISNSYKNLKYPKTNELMEVLKVDLKWLEPELQDKFENYLNKKCK
ncbi:MAG: hypothetical protein LBC85_03295 [Fibromonadaceae bacterium]|jgi:hypothetical protein|nr:hypothetical protein [Fibromonadaceae bacterium]